MLKDLYKKPNYSLIERQEERRKRLLEEQKEKRHLLQDKLRVLQPAEELQLKKPHCKFKLFKDLYQSEWSLQLSEWMREKPEDLTDWFLMPCPRGQRCMVVAHNGHTEMFSKTGRKCFSFRSMLPGDRNHPHQLTILDCIYEKSQDIFYVLDALSFGNQELVECDSKFRFFWLRSKVDENPELTERNKFNDKAFHVVDYYDFENGEAIIEVLQRFPLWPDNNPPLDGFLFYHKEASYNFGTTPLVCWLFPFMIYDVLNLQTNQQYVKPFEYKTPLQYMDLFDSLQEKKSRMNRKFNKVIPMEAEDQIDHLDNGDNNDGDEFSLDQVLNQQRELEMEDSEDFNVQT